MTSQRERANARRLREALPPGPRKTSQAEHWERERKSAREERAGIVDVIETLPLSRAEREVAAKILTAIRAKFSPPPPTKPLWLNVATGKLQAEKPE